MNKDEKLKVMKEAILEDRQRFFKVSDTLLLQPKYIKYTEELEQLVQKFRDITKISDYPNIDWPPVLPQWFPKIYFASKWKKDEFFQENLENENQITYK